MRLALFITLFLLAIPSSAKDLGVQGETFPIIETSIFDQIRQRLDTPQMESFLENEKMAARERTYARINRPEPVIGVTEATRTREFIYDPTIYSKEDILDHEGNIIVPRGSSYNALSTAPLRQPFIFINADRESHILWAQSILQERDNTKVILTGGSPLELMERWQRRVYFDQTGHLTSTLGIRHVPAFVDQDGDVLKVQEIALIDKDNRQ